MGLKTSLFVMFYGGAPLGRDYFLLKLCVTKYLSFLS